MINRRGFTLVELAVVIAVLAILVTLATLGLNQYLEDGRDTRRSASVSTIAESLEKYYDQNGEYPSCSELTGPAGTVTTVTLRGLDQAALITPLATTGTTNSLRCDTTLTTTGEDFIEYAGDGSASCTGSGSCLSFTLRYRNDATATVEEIPSRRNANLATSGLIQNLSATPVCFTGMNLTWAAIPNTTGYDLQRATTSDFSTAITSTSPTSNSANITGLTPGTDYFFRVRPVGGAQAGSWSNTAAQSTLELGAPTISATVDSTTQITVNWTVPANSGCGGSTTSYSLQRATNSSFSAGLVTTNGITGTSSVASGLTIGQVYYFRVQGVTTGDTSNWSNTAASSTVPNAPTGVTATVNSATQYTIAWTASSGATSYVVRYGTTASANTYSATTSATSLAISANILQGTLQYFQVFAVSGGVESVGSSIVSGTTPINAPGAYNMGGSTDGTWVNGSSPVSCPSGTTANFYWNANGGLWVQGTQHRNVGYYLNPGQGVTLQVATRCEKGGVTSGWTWSSNSYGYTRPGMNLSLAMGADGCWGGYCGRIVNANWNNMCGTGAPTIYAKQLSAYGQWTADSPSSDSISWKGASSPGVWVDYYNVNIGCTSGAASIQVISAYKCNGCS